jgi:hypothetical protein
MNKLVLDRINGQIKNSKIPRIITLKQKIQKKELQKPLGCDILKDILIKSCNLVKKNNMDITFNNVEEFVSWYEPLKDRFSEAQNIALSSLVSARDMINNGCGCKRKQRLDAAGNYFRTFWQENSHTDLPYKVMEVSNSQSVTFVLGSEIILKIP